MDEMQKFKDLVDRIQVLSKEKAATEATISILLEQEAKQLEELKSLGIPSIEALPEALARLRGEVSESLASYEVLVKEQEEALAGLK